MAYQISSQEAAMTSWGDATSTVDYCYHLVTTAALVNSINLTITADALEVTGTGATSRRTRNGLRSWMFSGDAFFPRTAAKVGSQGSVTFASGDVLWVDGFDLNISWDEYEITRFGQSDATWKEFKPGLFPKISGTFTGFMDSGTAVSPPIAFTGSSAAATFKVTEDGTDDNVFTGNINLQEVATTANITSGELQRKTYKFDWDGAFTTKSTGTPGINLFPASTAGVALAQTTWDKDGDGVADRTVVLTAATGRTFTGYAWLKSVALSVRANQLIKASYTGRGSGVLTIA